MNNRSPSKSSLVIGDNIIGGRSLNELLDLYQLLTNGQGKLVLSKSTKSTEEAGLRFPMGL